MLVAFLGTHVPLLSLLIYFVISASFPIDIKVKVIAITLIGTALTLYALHNLLAPVTLTFLAMRHYLNNRQLSSLPTNFTDQAGILMADTFHTLKKLGEVIEHIANYDNLTGLPNRILFDNRLREVISQNQNNQLFTVISLSVDRLKDINNSLGYEMGNLVLRSAAQRLSNCLSEHNTLARLESNKFTIIKTNIKSVDEVVALVEKIINELTKSVSINNNEVFNSVSIGISIYPNDHTEIDSILGNAVRAMDRAKEQGQNKYQFYSRELNDKLQERLILEKDLHNAVKNGEMLLHYQRMSEKSKLKPAASP